MNSRYLICKLLLLASLCLTSTPTLAQDDERANALELLGKAQQSLAVVVAAGRKDQALSLQNAKSKPFWDGLKDLNANLDKTRAGLTNKDNSFFVSLASARAGHAQAEIALIMSGSTDQGVADSMQTLGGILQTLHQNYSKEAARLKQGGELTAAEKQQLDRLIAQQDELLKKLEAVEKNVAANNAEMKAGIAKIKEESKKIRRSRRNVGGFVGGFFAAHIMYDWLWGWHWWWGPWGGWCPGFIDINVIIWDDWVDDYDYDWAIADSYVDVADLELDLIDIEAAEEAASLDFLAEGDFSFDGDIGSVTEDIDLGWDDVSTDIGNEIASQYESNFENPAIYDRQVPVETFQDHAINDFGSDFDTGTDFGFDF